MIVGYSITGDRVPALHIGGYTSGNALVYVVGIVKTGLPPAFVDAAAELHESIRRPDAPCLRVAKDVAQTWVEPKLVSEIAYVEAMPGVCCATLNSSACDPTKCLGMQPAGGLRGRNRGTACPPATPSVSVGVPRHTGGLTPDRAQSI